MTMNSGSNIELAGVSYCWIYRDVESGADGKYTWRSSESGSCPPEGVSRQLDRILVERHLADVLSAARRVSLASLCSVLRSMGAAEAALFEACQLIADTQAWSADEDDA